MPHPRVLIGADKARCTPVDDWREVWVDGECGQLVECRAGWLEKARRWFPPPFVFLSRALMGGRELGPDGRQQR
eukprot:2688822-Rhodomonas_salina.1